MSHQPVLETPLRETVHAPKIISRKQKGAARSRWRGLRVDRISQRINLIA